MVGAGAAGDDRGAVPNQATFLGLRLAAVRFG
jgi:hypothetical protein